LRDPAALPGRLGHPSSAASLAALSTSDGLHPFSGVETRNVFPPPRWGRGQGGGGAPRRLPPTPTSPEKRSSHFLTRCHASRLPSPIRWVQSTRHAGAEVRAVGAYPARGR